MPRKILMVTSEAVPFAKTGGLADAVSALSAQLHKMGHDVRIIMPRYYSIPTNNLKKLGQPLGVPVGNGEEWVGVYRTRLPEQDVPVYLIDHENYFGREGVYGPSSDVAFTDNAERFNLLSRATFQLCRMLSWIPDIMHCHDWVSGPVPLYMQTIERQSEFAGTVSVMTIHNLGYQGNFSTDKARVFPLSFDQISRRFGIHDNQLNYLKMGIENAEIVSTVSPTYAEEIQTQPYGFGLDSALRYRRSDLFGILNGVDYSHWDPETDKRIPYNYTSENMANKTRNKKALQKHFGLPQDSKIPVVGMVSRMVNQKGFGELCGPSHGSLYSICKDMNLQFVIVGSGEYWCEQELFALAGKLPNLRVWIGYNEDLAHLVEAGSDFFLMPSQYEPCGLNQLYSMKYGTLPIVRQTGGLADTVENYDEATGKGTGFVFKELSPRAIYDTVGWAVYAWFNKKDHIRKMRKTAMGLDFNWERSAREYLNVYQWAIDRRLGLYP